MRKKATPTFNQLVSSSNPDGLTIQRIDKLSKPAPSGAGPNGIRSKACPGSAMLSPAP
jgi:hypothetical protein